MNEAEIRAAAASLGRPTDKNLSDDQYEQIAAASRVAATAKLKARGFTNEQIANFHADLEAKPTPPEELGAGTITSEQMLEAWQRFGEAASARLGGPVTDEQAASIKIAQERAQNELQAQQVAQMDEMLFNFRRERDLGRTTPGHRFYIDPLEPLTETLSSPKGPVVVASSRAKLEAFLEKQEETLIYERLQKGLPAEPAPRLTPAQRAVERFNADQNRK